MHPAQLTIPAQCGVVYCVLWQQLNDNSEAPIHPSHPLPFTPTSPQLGRQSLSHLVGYRKKQHVCAYWCACIISEVLRVACGPYNMLVSSGAVYMNGRVCFFLVVVVVVAMKASKALLSSVLLNGTPFYRTLPASPAGLMEPSCGGQAQTPGSPLICSQRLLCQMG